MHKKTLEIEVTEDNERQCRRVKEKANFCLPTNMMNIDESCMIQQISIILTFDNRIRRSPERRV